MPPSPHRRRTRRRCRRNETRRRRHRRPSMRRRPRQRRPRAILAAPPLNDARAAAAVSPLDGWWLVTHATESSRGRPDNGLLVVYRIELRQDGARVFGKGSTWSKNGYVLRPSERTPVVATATWHDN